MPTINKKKLEQKINGLEGLTSEEKAALRELLHQKKYGLVWEDKPEAAEEQLRQELPILVEAVDKFVAGQPIAAKVTADTKEDLFIIEKPLQELNTLEATELDYPNHIIIEGDNLHALTSLSYTHEGKIDVIYIDPPYNTGNKDFVYNDRYVDKEDGYRHSKWLSFMERRLRIAKRLLKDTGVIFISIDDNEQAQLRLLCDEIFGLESFVANIIWQKIYSPKNSAKHLSVDHDYIYLFAKSSNLWSPIKLPRTDEQKGRYKNPDNDPRGPWKPGDLSARNYYGEGTYSIETPSGRKIGGPPKGNFWRVSKEKLTEMDQDGRIWWGESGSNVPAIKRFLSEVQAGIVPQTLWKYEDVGHTQEGKKEINSILEDPNLKFDTPKPVRLLERILRISASPNATILDFFAGSGTTLHATMALNAEDGGNRQCILVTNNENNIAEEVCYERNRRVIQGYKNAKGEEVPGLTANNLRYYRMDFVSRERSAANRRRLTVLATDMLRVRENCYPEEATNLKDARLFREHGKAFLVIYDEEVIQSTLEHIPTWAEGLPEGVRLKVYVFSDSDYTYEDDFESVLQYVDLCALPQAILETYRKVLPKKGMAKTVADEPAEENETDLFVVQELEEEY